MPLYVYWVCNGLIGIVLATFATMTSGKSKRGSFQRKCTCVPPNFPGLYLPPRNLSTCFISSQAAPRRRFFQHLTPQVKHKIQSAWSICHICQKQAEISAAASKYHKWGPGNNLHLVFIFRFYQLQRSLVLSLSPSLRWAALASDVALFCSRAERWCAAQTCGVWTPAQNWHSVDAR